MYCSRPSRQSSGWSYSVTCSDVFIWGKFRYQLRIAFFFPGRKRVTISLVCSLQRFRMWIRRQHFLLSQNGNAAHTKTSRHVCSVLGFLYRWAYSLMNRGISVSIGSRPRAGRHHCGGRVFLFVTASRPALVPTQLSVLFLPEATQPCVKLIVRIHLVPGLWMCGVIPPSPCVFMTRNTWYSWVLVR